MSKSSSDSAGIRSYYQQKLDATEIILQDRLHDLRRQEAQRNELNSTGLHPIGSIVIIRFLMVLAVRLLKDEIYRLQEPASQVGEVVKSMGKTQVLVKV